MALNISNGLQPFQMEGQRSSVKASVFLVAVWMGWITFISTVNFPLRFSLHATSIVLLVGSFWWSIKEGAFYLLLMSLVFGFFSLTPSGFYWVSAFAIFLILRFISYRFTVSTSLQILFSVLLIAFVFDFSQAVLLGQVLSTKVISFRLITLIFYSSFFQALMAWIVSRPLLVLIEAK